MIAKILCLVFLPLGLTQAAAFPQISLPDERQPALHALQRDAEIAGLLQALHVAGGNKETLFRNVSIVDPLTGKATRNRSVLVAGEWISWIGPTGQEPSGGAARIVDGRGRFLAPGLTDMHVHPRNMAGWLLNLAAGVTTVREMAGLPWVLRVRENVQAGRMLAPNLNVGGPLINGRGLRGWGVVPGNPLDARRLVRQQAACGYDFIKVHNRLPEPTLVAVAEQAKALGIDLIGHVPHGVKVRTAADLGMRTMEHLKGFLDDRTLTIGDRDYGVVTGRDNLWIDPTLHTDVQYARGEWAKALMNRPEMRFVPIDRRESWRKQWTEPLPPTHGVEMRSMQLRRSIVRELSRAGARFLAGSDAVDGYPFNYPFNVPGFALLDELDMLAEAGLSPLIVYQATTVEPAAAMRQSDTFGRVEQGLRADLLLLDANPTVDLGTLRRADGVMVRGVWLSKEALQLALARLAVVQERPDAKVEFSAPGLDQTISRVETLSEGGFVFDAMLLEQLAQMAERNGWAPTAARLRTLAAIPMIGPCAESRPW